MITEWDGTAGSSDKNDYTYDTLGRVLAANRTVSSTLYAMAYTYDLAGNLTGISYPSSSGTRRKVDYLYNANAELNIVRDATGTAFDYVTAVTYANLGPLNQLDLGNGVRTTLGWNKNGEMTSLLTQKVGGATHLNLAYTYFNNGQIQEIGNGLNNLKSEKYTYDELRRLFTAQRGPDASVQRKYQYDYDRFGNRWAQTLVAGSGLGGTLDLYSASNRIATTGFGYANGSGQDQAGNLTANGPGSSYTYNMENFMTAAGSTTYAYDAQGRRVRKTVGGTVTEYFYSASELITEKTGTAWTDYIFFGDQRIAQLDVGSIAVRFTNDSCSGCGGPPVGGGDRNLFINSITIGSTTILPNDPSVSYTGAPCNGPAGMYCSGDMITSAIPSGQTIAVNAYGSPDYNIYPHMQIWVNGKLMGEWDVTGTAQNYTATAVRYFAVDHLGSTRACTDADGNNLGTCDYEPFGEVQPGTTCSVPTNFRFAGMEWDSNAGPNGLYHTWFRQYDPNQGRWMSADPLGGHAGIPQSLNRYGGLLNDPVNLTDPFGLDVFLMIGNCLWRASVQVVSIRIEGEGDESPPGITITLEERVSCEGGLTGDDIATETVDPGDDLINPFGRDVLAEVYRRTRFVPDAVEVGVCIAGGVGFGDEEVFSPALTHAGVDAVKHALEEPGTATAAARAYYGLTDKRFTRWGKFSKVLVPRAAAAARPVLVRTAAGVSVVGWVYLGHEAIKVTKNCVSKPR